MSKRMISAMALAVAAHGVALCGTVGPAKAHVVLETKEAVAESYFKAVFMVGHGCQGSPTVKITVTLPEGVDVARPQPKPGWIVTMTKAPLAPAGDANAHAHHGAAPVERVATISWAGGPLEEGFYDEFVALLKLPAATTPGELRFPTSQECVQGSMNWAETPKPGEKAKEPAPVLRLIPKASAAKP